MLTHVPLHDDLVSLVQVDVIRAVHALGWPEAGESCQKYGISKAALRKIYLWRPSKFNEPFESFNLAKLLDAHSWAVDALAVLETGEAGVEEAGVEV